MKDMDPIKIFTFDYSRQKILSLLLDLGPTPQISISNIVVIL